MRQRRRAQNHAAVHAAQLHCEEEQGNPDKDQRNLAEGLCCFLIIAPLQHAVHGVEKHRHRDVQQRQQDAETAVVRVRIDKSPRAVIQAVAQVEGQLLGKDVPEDEIHMFDPALTAALIHFRITAFPGQPITFPIISSARIVPTASSLLSRLSAVLSPMTTYSPCAGRISSSRHPARSKAPFS